MLRICFVVYEINEKGGAQRVAVSLANELSSIYEVHLFSVCHAGEVPTFTVKSSVQYHAELPGQERIRNTLFRGATALKEYVKKNDIDILLAVGGCTIPFVWRASIGSAVKTIFCEHMNLNEGSKHFIDRVLRKMTARSFDKIVTLTKRDCQEYQKRMRIGANKVVYIYNWIEDNLASHSCSYDTLSKKIISVGRISPEKGYDMLVGIAKQVFAKHPDWRWDIYGDGPLHNEIQDLIVQNGLEQHVFLMGVTDHIYDMYPKYSFYVMTSRNEGLPLVLLEAKGCGLPILSFDCRTGPAEIVRDGIDGYLVPPLYVDQMRERIFELIENAELRKEFSSQARDNVHLFDKTHILHKWMELLEALAGTGE